MQDHYGKNVENLQLLLHNQLGGNDPQDIYPVLAARQIVGRLPLRVNEDPDLLRKAWKPVK